MSEWRIDPYIETYTGKKFYLHYDPEKHGEDAIDIVDIAHALSNQCRYTGHCSRFYSVAEHSYLCSYLAPEGFELAALLHDASEAYISDISSPFKGEIKGYREIEEGIMARIADHFGLVRGFEHGKMVKGIDTAMLLKEAEELVPSKGKDWGIYSDVEIEVPQGYRIGKEPSIAKNLFLQRYYSLELGGD